MMSTHKVAALIICVASVFRTKCGATNELQNQLFCYCDDSCEYSRDGVCDEPVANAKVDTVYYEYHDDSDVRSVYCAKCSDCTDCSAFYDYKYTYLQDDLLHNEYYASQGLEYYYSFDESPIPNAYQEPFATTSVIEDPQDVGGYYYQFLEDEGDQSAPNVYEMTNIKVIEDPPAQKQGSKSKVHNTRGSSLFAIIALALIALPTCLLVAACKQQRDRAKRSEQGVGFFENRVENHHPRLYATAAQSKQLLV